MPNQNSVSNAKNPLSHNQEAFELSETINENLRLIDSVTCLVISSYGNVDDDVVADAMLIIGELMSKANHANDAIMQIIKRGNHE